MGARAVITALTICDQPYDRAYHGLRTLVHAPGGIRTAADAQAAWLSAAAKVDTEHFFYLDSDDDLPVGYMDVLEEAVALDQPLVYTDEAVRSADRPEYVREAAPYTQQLHLAKPMLVHHLALCRTADAMEALLRIEPGHFWPEMQLYWELAKGGAAYLPKVGYLWNRRPTGLHTNPAIVMAQTRSALWCKANP